MKTEVSKLRSYSFPPMYNRFFLICKFVVIIMNNNNWLNGQKGVLKVIITFTVL